MNKKLILLACLFFVVKSFAQTLSDLQKLAFNGNPAAQFQLGKKYYFGENGYLLDYGLASYWFLSAAEKGYADAQAYAAMCYLTANGVPENAQKGKYWAELSVNQNNEWGYYQLGIYYLHHVQNIPEAVFWINKYYEISNNEYAKNQLKDLSSKGYCDSPIENFSSNLINLAQSGLPDACYKLGLAYLHGTFGLEKDINKVPPLIKQATEKGFLQAYSFLAYIEYLQATGREEKDSAIAKMKDAINKFIPDAYCYMALINEEENQLNDAAKWHKYYYTICNEAGYEEYINKLAGKGYTFSIPNATSTYDFQPDVCIYIGNQLINKQQYSKALEYFNFALTKEPNNYFATNNRGVCYFNMGNLSKAKAEFKRAIEIEPDNDMAKNNLQIVQNERTARTLNVINAVAVGLNNAAGTYSNYQQPNSGQTSSGSNTTKSQTTARTPSKCSLCDGTGEVVAYSASYVGGLKYCKKCDKDVPEGHYHNICPSCKGNGSR